MQDPSYRVKQSLASLYIFTHNASMETQKRTSEKILEFYSTLSLHSDLPKGIQVINPFHNLPTRRLLEVFLDKFFSDAKKRIPVLGINPGRFGSGVTGIPFTDPRMLREKCLIENDFGDRIELSSQFVYSFIEYFGGVTTFYDKFMLGAVSPVGFMKNRKNYNYYDDSELLGTLRPFLETSLAAQREMCGVDVVILLGTGKNAAVFASLNDKLRLFKHVFSLEHPRFIMQYNRRHLGKYLTKYDEVFKNALSLTQLR